jgi:hypothetical protein
MKKLENEFERKGYVYKVIQRTNKYELVEEKSDFALVSVYLNDELIGHEVFYIIKQKETDLNFGGTSVHYEAKETWPSDSVWGQKGWSYSRKEYNKAEMKYLSLISNQENQNTKQITVKKEPIIKSNEIKPKKGNGRGRPKGSKNKI